MRKEALKVELRIGICDDEIMWQKKISDSLKRYETERKIQLSIYSFSGEDELRAFKGRQLQVLFMDTEFGSFGGIQLACEVNRRWPECQIIYLSESAEYLYEAYRSKHLAFCMKEQMEEKLYEILEMAKDRIEQTTDKVRLTFHGDQMISLPLHEILYFERRERVTKVVSRSCEYAVDERIGVLEDRLASKDFIRCHNSYIVYLPAVKKYTNKSFFMCDGSEILISRGYREKTRKAFESWAGIGSDEWEA